MTTQSEEAARRTAVRDANHDAQLKTLQTAYNPDALHRTLDWIGNLFGSGHSYAPSGGSRAIDWIARQFGNPYRIGGSENPMNYGSFKDPWGDQTGPAAEAWYRNVANSPTPFGNVQYGPNKPVTKISSAPAIQRKLAATMAPQYNPEQNMGPLPAQDAPAGSRPGEPGPVPDFNFGPLPPTSGSGAGPGGGPPWGGMPGEDRAVAPPWPPAEIPGAPVAQRPAVPGQPRRPSLSGLGNQIGSIFGLSEPEPGGTVDRLIKWRNSLVDSPFGKAHGGPIGYMRGGYPELYGSERMPVRHTFDSGGENFVGDRYGNSSGRADDVNAKLSPKEYVMDAESMALLGDGNPDHGAQKMDEMRANLRKEKGAALAKGKFSPKAKSAQEYLVGDPISAGLRRRGRDKG